MPRSLTRPQQRTRPRPRADSRNLHQLILDTTESLLVDRRFDELAVADILDEAQVSRASFYFYFASKHEVLAELVRRSVAAGLHAARPWTERATHDSPRDSLRQGTTAGAHLWRERAAVLRAMVENWRSDPTLSQLWVELMDRFTQATVERVERDRASGLEPAVSRLPTPLLASALTWMSERLYYLAALGIAPFDDEQQLIETLTEIYAVTIYGSNGGPRRRRKPGRRAADR